MLMSERDYKTHLWYAVATKARDEAVAKANLERQGYEVYLPTIGLKKRRRGRWMPVTEPLFPGYLFVSLALGVDDPAPIRSTVGCVGLVRFGQVHVSVPSVLIAALQGAQEGVADAPLPFNEGDKVRLIAGPFAGIEAVFEMPRGEDRAHVLVELLGKVQRLTVNQDDLSK
jgi:transcriptional antiterminator RfaH